MKKLNLYYVYDNIGSCAITGLIPCANDLTAAIGFRDSYINTEKPSPYNYKALELRCIGEVSVDSDGCFKFGDSFEPNSKILGKDIITFISDELKNRGIDDNFVDEEIKDNEE